MADYNPIERLTSKLEHVKSKGRGKWMACCPAHDDRNPSLSIKETDNGTILIRCWAGCGAADVVHAVGMELKDLFPIQTAHRHKRTPFQRRQNASYKKVLQRINNDLNIIILAAGDVTRGVFSQADMTTLIKATNRVRSALEAANV